MPETPPPDPPAEDERTARIRRIVDDCVRRWALGESISAQSLIDANPSLMPELAAELNKMHLIARAARSAAGSPEDSQPAGSRDDVEESDSAAHALRIRCPHCRHPVELVDDATLSELLCDSCGSQFSLVWDTTGESPEPPRTLAHFELKGHLGMGGFGAVWRAYDTELKRDVAIKIPRRSQLSREQEGQFLREARIAAQLNHPNIVSVHEIGRDGDVIYIVSDLVEGKPLSEWLRTRRLSAKEAAGLCAKIATALHYAHQTGVVHRDLKPANIMMDANDEPQIMDFGLAKRDAGEITMTIDGQILGTPAYMSPEQARGEAHQVDRRTDVYSLGVILFELLTGELPFRGSARMLVSQVVNDDAPSPRKFAGSLPRDLETICLKCLAKEPARRYPTARALAEELQRFQNGEPIRARPISTIDRAWRYSKRKPLAATLAALCVMLAIVGPSIAVKRHLDTI